MLLSAGFFSPGQAAAVDQVEQEHGDQSEQQHEQVRVQLPEIRYDHVANLGDGRDLREDLLVSQPEEDCAGQET